MELSLDEARKLERRHIGTEHLLLGLLSAKDNVTEKVLENLGVETIRLQQHLLARIKETDIRSTAS